MKMAVTTTNICEDYENAKILEAACVAMETGSMTPIIKQELRFIIQSRRLAEGKSELSELDVKFVPPVTTELTPEEHIKKENRREQNRIAARKFRKKQTASLHKFKKRIQNLESENTRLSSELTTLAREKRSLQGKLQSHLDMCGCVISTELLV
ncbi:basic leucine zipper transcriptional factor ATF-like 3 [Pecten maximus]|uniref:basic leucine zipper transcriptional factor ATF-like 3 n=1 Tax=Pecten maximus TaxID=6579 RepID=UPI0014582866|nr:basic leucine zipper transcriptional factor ATF-like 3 [Pecten maximus]XP_033735256.1 basic leucine zipper transcriptional factor ATF-like 3 [Pecten maximus]